MNINIAKKDTITKAMLFNGKAILSVVDVTQLADFAIKRHAVIGRTAEALARTLAYTAFLSAGMKGTAINVSVTIEGDGEFGKIITAGKTGGLVRGTVQNTKANPITLQDGIGRQGTLSVVKDFGLKEAYKGRVELASCDIDGDFAYYFAASEQLNTVCVSGADIGKGSECNKAGAIILQPMPNCDEETLFVLQDIASNNFANAIDQLKNLTPIEIIENNFGHFECKIIDVTQPSFVCSCSKERVEETIRALGAKEALKIIDEVGYIEVHCDFCNTFYRFSGTETKAMFNAN